MKKNNILFIFLLVLANTLSAQTNTENYIRTRAYLDSVSITTPGANKIETVQYYNGLGKEKQVVNVKASPLGNDLVIPTVYDFAGRQSREYLPIPQSSTSNGEIYQQAAGNVAFPIPDITNFYNGEKIFTEKFFENSPIDRVLQQKTAGTQWDTHPLQYTYEFNNGDEVKRYTATFNYDNNEAKIVLSGNYAVNTLSKNTISDEDGNQSIEYQNAEGQIILVRKVLSPTENADTYYVYNEHSQLAYIIPPLASVGNLDDNILNLLCYQLIYDRKDRVIGKKLPGKGWEFMVYDKSDRLIMTQDSNLRKNGKWVLSKYDKIGRLIYTGIITGGSRSDMQNQAGDKYIVENRSIDGFMSSGMQVFYTNNFFTNIETLLTVNYYDTYPSLPSQIVIPGSIFNQPVITDNFAASVNTKGLQLASYIKNVEDDNWTKTFTFYDRRGRDIATHAINHLGGYTKIEKELSFAGTVKKTITYHKRLNTDIERTITEVFNYDQQNRLLVHTHQVDSNPVEILTQNKYNEISQVETKKIGGTNISQPLQTIDYRYNIRGWMTQINNPSNLGTDLFGYKINYNQVDGLEVPNQDFTDLKVKPRFNGNIAEVAWKTLAEQNEPLKTYGYVYDRLNRLSAGFYQKAGNESAKEFYEKIEYDLNGNITRLRRSGEMTVGSTTAFAIDNLKYDYSGNKLTKITDEQQNPTGYPYIPTPAAITYDNDNTDGNGNMTSHLDKGIYQIEYNYLNLPNNYGITQNNLFLGNKSFNLYYTYRADGKKVSKLYSSGGGKGQLSTRQITDYLDGFQYSYYENSGPCLWCKPSISFDQENLKDGGIILDPTIPIKSKWILDFVPTAEGFYSFKENRYIYQYEDHLGNARISFAQNSTGSLDILDTNNYYPFGLNHIGGGSMGLLGSYLNYKYNGKELQESGMYDYGARMYMPDIARWGVLDPLAEKSRRFSPYTYAVDNPIMFIDPDGREAQGCCGYLGRLASTYYSGMYQGAKQVAKESYQGIKQFVSHPVESTKALANNPGGALKAGISKSVQLMVTVVASPVIVKENIKSGNATASGQIAGKVLATAAIEGGSAIATEGAGSLIRNIATKAGRVVATEGAGTAGKLMKQLSRKEASTIIGGGTDANVVRGGTCLACQFENGSGVTVSSDGLLNGVSVNSVPGLSIEELAAGIPNGKIGVTTVKEIEALGGKVVPSPNTPNPNHATLSGITAEQAEKLFNPVIKNPTKVK